MPEFTDTERDEYETRTERNVKILLRNNEALPMVAARLPFANKTGSLQARAVFGMRRVENAPDGRILVTGRHGSYEFPVGKLPDSERAVLLDDVRRIRDYAGNFYIVLSYDTPIGWTRSIEDYGKFYIPAVEYSPTTTRHQKAIGA